VFFEGPNPSYLVRWLECQKMDLQLLMVGLLPAPWGISALYAVGRPAHNVG
jgi:hypothetical protein